MAGLWAEDLARGLLWKKLPSIVQPKVSTTALPGKSRRVRAMFPTWSWASYAPARITFFPDLVPDDTLKADVNTSLWKGSEMSTVTVPDGGRLRLRGLGVRCTWVHAGAGAHHPSVSPHELRPHKRHYPEWASSNPEDVGSLYVYYCTDLSNDEEDFLALKERTRHESRDEGNYGAREMEVVCLRLGSKEVGQACLVLREVSMAGIYVRVGVADIDERFFYRGEQMSVIVV